MRPAPGPADAMNIVTVRGRIEPAAGLTQVAEKRIAGRWS